MTKQTHAEWTTKDINDLPDSSFAYIEDGGTKDSDGKTTPRSLRHLPYKDAQGNPDLPHVRNALARLEQTKIPDTAKTSIRKKLQAILDKSKMSSRYLGIFPLEFDEDMQIDEQTAIPDTIHLIPIGQWEHDMYGQIIINPSDIREFAMNFNAGVRKGVFITAGHECMTELPAVGWITSVETRDNGLWGMVEWNDEGKELLADKAFKFFSPEFYRDYEDPQTHQIFRNVLTGGALTKSPYFKELEAIVFSEPKISKQFNDNQNNTMDLNAILAKKIEELTVEEIAFIKENVATLTDEQKVTLTAILEAPAETDEEKTAREAKEVADKEVADKATADANIAAGLNADGSAKEPEPAPAGEGEGDKVAGSEKVMITASELSTLRKDASEGKQAFAEMAKQKLDTAIKGLVFSNVNQAGKFLPKSEAGLRTFMATLNETQRAQFSTLVAELPKAIAFNEIGSGVGATEGTAQAEVEAKVKATMEGDKMSYSDAVKHVFAENDGLEARYNSELQGA